MALPTPDTKLLANMLTTPVDEPIPPELVKAALSNPPFITLPGAFNIRDVGTFAPGYVKPRTVFRSGMLEHIPGPSRPALRTDLGLSNIYDLRRRDEIKAPLAEVDGIKLFSCPYMDGEEMPPEIVAADFVIEDGEPSSKGYRDMYDVILKGYTGGYRQAFEALKTAKEGDAVLFHCTAGKDRTGVLAALILDLMGAPAEVIANEYALTRIGTEPAREKLIQSILKSFGSPGSTEGHTSSTQSPSQGADMESPGVRNLLTTSAPVMVDFVTRLRCDYGGAEGYMKDYLGFSDEDVKAIRENLQPSA